MAGSRAGVRNDVDVGGEGDLEDGARRRGQLPQGAPYVPHTCQRGLEEDKEEEEEEEEKKEEEGEEKEEEVSSKGNVRRGWFGAGASSWGPVGWIWSGWGGSGRAADGGMVRGDANESIATADEEVRTNFVLCVVLEESN